MVSNFIVPTHRSSSSVSPFRFIVSKQFNFINKRHKIYDVKTLPDKINEALIDVGINDPDRVKNSYSFELSGGMAQRVVIALATFSKPRFLVSNSALINCGVAIAMTNNIKFHR